MMGKVKQAISFMLVVSMLLAYMPGMVFAADGDNNDTYLTADPIYANSTVIGETTKNDKVDYYKYTVTEPGYFTVSCSQTGSKGSWSMVISDSKNVTLQSFYAAKTRETNIFNVSAGECVYIMIKNSSYGEYALTVNAVAANDWEQEPNDDQASALSLNNGEWINGVGYKKNDEDWYQFTIQDQGYLSFEFETQGSKNGSWTVEVYDDQQNRLEKETVKNSFQSGKYCDEEGKTFYLHIKTSVDEYTYQVRAVFTTAIDWEKEKNDILENATEIEADQTLHGVLNTEKDVDIYKFVFPGNGACQFKFSNVDQDTKAKWNVSLYDAKNKCIQSVKTNAKDQEQDMIRLNFKKGQAVYLKVQHGFAEAGIEYAVTLEYDNDTAWELEPDNSFSTAFTLKKGKTITGTCYASTDKDYYVYKATKAGTIKFVFSGEANEGSGWDITVYDQNKKVVKSAKAVKDTKTLAVKAKKGIKYYFVVKPRNKNMTDISYEITVK